MNITDELERLARLHKDGTLNDEEFAQAKKKLLAESEQDNPNRALGEAMNRYVSFQMFISVVGFLVLLILLFGVVIPHFRDRDHTLRIEWPH